MNIIDAAVFFYILISAFFGFLRGFIMGVIELVGVVVAYITARIVYSAEIGFLSAWTEPGMLRNALEGISAFYLVIIVFAVIKRILKMTILKKDTEIWSFDKVGGIFVGVMKSTAISFALAYFAAMIPLDVLPENIQETVASSWVISSVGENSPEVFDEYVADFKNRAETMSAFSEIAKNPEKMKRLADDPAVKKIINTDTIQDIRNDPEIQEQINNKEYATLLQNPKIQALFKDPEIAELIKQIDLKSLKDSDEEY